MKIEIATEEEDKDIFCFKPTMEDIALVGRIIERTPYARLWRSTMAYLSNYACNQLYNSIAGSTVIFSLDMGDTAAINMITKEIYLNPTFIRKWVKTPSDLAGLILHELMHPVVDPQNKYVGEMTPLEAFKNNVALDSLINSILFNISSSLCSLHRRFYNLNRFPDALLRPGSTKSWLRSSEPDPTKRTPLEGLRVKPSKRHLDIYRNLYPTARNRDKAIRPSVDTIKEVFFDESDESEEQITIILDPNGQLGSCGAGSGKGKGKTIVIGPKKPDGQETISGFDGKNKISPEQLKELPPKILEAIQQISDEWDEKFPQPKKEESPLDEEEQPKGEEVTEDMAGTGAGKGGSLKDRWTKLSQRQEVFRAKNRLTQEQRARAAKDVIEGIYKVYRKGAFAPNEKDSIAQNLKTIDEMLLDDGILDAFLAASMRDVRGEIVQLLEEKPESNRTVVPLHVTRSGLVNIALGQYPVFWNREAHQKDEQKRTTRVYLDVSGSMWDQIKWVLRLIVELEHRCHSDIWVFSTEIVQTSMDELKKGQFKSTGGTSFNEVIEHFLAQEEDIENCLIITDGLDRVSPEMKKQLEDAGKNAYVLIVDNRPPYKGTVESAMEWAKKVFLKERRWWADIGMRQPK